MNEQITQPGRLPEAQPGALAPCVVLAALRRGARLIEQFWRASLHEELAYRANFLLSLLHSLLNLATGAAGVWILFGQVESIRGWTFAGTLALLGVYLTAAALRRLFIGPSLEALAGMDGEIWTGQFDFTLLRPVDTQFLASFRRWRALALFDLALGLGVIGTAAWQMEAAPTLAALAAFTVALLAGIAILYAILLAFSALIFWSPGFLFTWLFDAVFQMARYPLGAYPSWVRLALTWVIPVGLITTVPAQALTGAATPLGLVGVVGLAATMTLAASLLFRRGLRRYHSASS
jgi:ABC-2 type transport system permease protein